MNQLEKSELYLSISLLSEFRIDNLLDNFST